MKKTLSVILCAVLLFTLSACGGQEAAYDKLKNIIIEKGTLEESDYSKTYKYEYRDYGETYFEFSTDGLPPEGSDAAKLAYESLSYHTKIDNSSVHIYFHKHDIDNFNIFVIIHDSDFGGDKYSLSTFSYEDSLKSEYDSRTELKIKKYDGDLSESKYKDIRKDVNAIAYSAVESFLKDIEYLGISKTDFGFTSFDK